MENPIIPAEQPVIEVLEECQHWLSPVLVSLFYEGGDKTVHDLPALYHRWIESCANAEAFQQNLIQQIQASENTLKKTLAEAAKHTPPLQKEFDLFMQAYEDFMARMNSIENDSLLTGHGIDTLTGFKSQSVMMTEIKRELDRRSRRGHPYSVALIRLDGSPTGEEREGRLKTVSQALRKCLRSFDDVYRINETDMLVGLKHSDLKGGMRFIERLKQEMKELEATFTFTSCVAEPDPADNMDKMLENLMKDLEEVAARGPGHAVKYEDLSPLQRFVSTLKDQEK